MAFSCLPKQTLSSQQKIRQAVPTIVEVPRLVNSGIQVEFVVVEHGWGDFVDRINCGVKIKFLKITAISKYNGIHVNFL